jgi:hypothetical protein
MVTLDREHLKVTVLATAGQDLKVSCIMRAKIWPTVELGERGGGREEAP